MLKKSSKDSSLVRKALMSLSSAIVCGVVSLLFWKNETSPEGREVQPDTSIPPFHLLLFLPSCYNLTLDCGKGRLRRHL